MTSGAVDIVSLILAVVGAFLTTVLLGGLLSIVLVVRLDRSWTVLCGVVLPGLLLVEGLLFDLGIMPFLVFVGVAAALAILGALYLIVDKIIRF